MSNILQEQYKTAFSNPDSGEKNQPHKDTSHAPDFSDISFSEQDVLKAINELGINSAPGPDKIPAKVIKECKDQLAPALVILWRRSLDSGLIPEDLLSQTIIPIYKKENKSLASNYRPISLTSHFIKISSGCDSSRPPPTFSLQTWAASPWRYSYTHTSSWKNEVFRSTISALWVNNFKFFIFYLERGRKGEHDRPFIFEIR